MAHMAHPLTEAMNVHDGVGRPTPPLPLPLSHLSGISRFDPEQVRCIAL